MHPTPLTPKPRNEQARPTKTEVRGGSVPDSPERSERATSVDEEAVLLGGAPADESEE